MKTTVAFNTWRLGTFDATITALEAQDFPLGEIELVIADELHRWRFDALKDRLAQCPFPVKHLPVERSLFPVASTMRAGNTCIRNAAESSELLVHVCDGAVPPPNFLAAHWEAYQRDPKAIGICPYRGRTVKPESWTLPMMGAWEMVEVSVRGGAAGQNAAWTGFQRRNATVYPGPLTWVRTPIDVEAVCEPLDPVAPQGGSPALASTGTQPGDVVTEWFAHYKVDAVPLAAYRAVNGWDEEYDGGYIYADIDMSLRLAAAGYTPRVIGYTTPVEVPILDFHLVTKRTPDVAFRQWWMAARLSETQKRLERGGDFRCVEGLDRPTRSHADDGALLAKTGETVRITLQRPWLASRYDGGRIDLVVSTRDAFIWERIVPPVLYGWKPLERVLGATVTSDSGPWGAAILDDVIDLDVCAQAKRIIFTGAEDEANALIDECNKRGWPCEAVEIGPDLCGVMVIPPPKEAG